MNFSLSTRWNASRHRDGGNMIDEIVGLGFVSLELSHDLSADLTPGVRHAIAAGIARAVSVHNFCPVPLGYARGSPDLYSPCSSDALEQESAIRNTRRTIEFAADIGADWIVLHAGHVEMENRTGQIIRLLMKGKLPGSAALEKLRARQMLEREKRGPRYMAALRRFLDEVLPYAESMQRRLAIEIQPPWESVPTELEMIELLTRYNSPTLRYWHDFGHGQIRENLGFINHGRWLERLEPFLAGMHIHDVRAPAHDHLVPGKGDLDFTRFAGIIALDLPKVLEPQPLTDADDLMEGVAYCANIGRNITGYENARNRA